MTDKSARFYKNAHFGGIVNSYTIAFSLRSGSNQLCRMLTRHGLGKPGELFQTIPDFDRPRATIDWYRAVVARHQRSGIFGSKMACDHRARLDGVLGGAMPAYQQ